MAIDTNDQKAFEASLLDYAKAGKAGLLGWIKDANLGQGEPNDQQFMVWFQTMAASDPDWVRMLQCRKLADPTKPAVDGADEVLARYQRLTTKGVQV